MGTEWTPFPTPTSLLEGSKLNCSGVFKRVKEVGSQGDSSWCTAPPLSFRPHPMPLPIQSAPASLLAIVATSQEVQALACPPLLPSLKVYENYTPSKLRPGVLQSPAPSRSSGTRPPPHPAPSELSCPEVRTSHKKLNPPPPFLKK